MKSPLSSGGEATQPPEGPRIGFFVPIRADSWTIIPAGFAGPPLSARFSPFNLPHALFQEWR
jgi:hypothetical protein